jgi:exodeoxyribonuclease V alpha subunit
MISSWKERKDLFETTSFLHQCGIGAAHSERLYAKYGKEVEKIIENNPYQLVKLSSFEKNDMQSEGISFEHADKIAQRMGIEKYQKERMECAIIYNILRITHNSGHRFFF